MKRRTKIKLERKLLEGRKMNREAVFEQLKIDEGVVYEIYEDHLGYATFGVGHLVTATDPEKGQPLGTPVSEERVREGLRRLLQPR